MGGFDWLREREREREWKGQRWRWWWWFWFWEGKPRRQRWWTGGNLWSEGGIFRCYRSTGEVKVWLWRGTRKPPPPPMKTTWIYSPRTAGVSPLPLPMHPPMVHFVHFFCSLNEWTEMPLLDLSWLMFLVNWHCSMPRTHKEIGEDSSWILSAYITGWHFRWLDVFRTIIFKTTPWQSCLEIHFDIVFSFFFRFCFIICVVLFHFIFLAWIWVIFLHYFNIYLIVSVKLGRLSVGSAKVSRSGIDDLLSSTDGGKHDYDWLVYDYPIIRFYSFQFRSASYQSFLFFFFFSFFSEIECLIFIHYYYYLVFLLRSFNDGLSID